MKRDLRFSAILFPSAGRDFANSLLATGVWVGFLRRGGYRAPVYVCWVCMLACKEGVLPVGACLPPCPAAFAAFVLFPVLFAAPAQALVSLPRPPLVQQGKTQPSQTVPELIFTLSNTVLSYLDVPGLGRFKAFSGADRNNPAMTMRRGVGAWPRGRYFVMDRPQGGWRQKLGDLFCLHPAGFFRLSEGCVTLAHRADFERVRHFLLSGPARLTLPNSTQRVYGILVVQ